MGHQRAKEFYFLREKERAEGSSIKLSEQVHGAGLITVDESTVAGNPVIFRERTAQNRARGRKINFQLATRNFLGRDSSRRSLRHNLSVRSVYEVTR